MCVCCFISFFVDDFDKPQIVVGGLHFLAAANATTCTRAIVDSLHKYDIKYDNVRSLVTDSARYMVKCSKALEIIVGDHLQYVQCWPHKLNLVGGVWIKELSELNLTVVKVKNIFLNTRKRRHLYASFLEEKYGEKRPLFPIPVIIRWNSWFTSVFYLADYLLDIADFCQKDEIKVLQNAGVEYFSAISKQHLAVVHVQAIFVKEHAKELVDLMLKLEGSSYPTSHLLHGELEHLKECYTAVSNGVYFDNTQSALESLSPTKAAEAKLSLQRVVSQAQAKLTSLMAQDPSKKMFEHLKVLDPKYIILATVNPSLIENIRNIFGFTSLDTEEITSGFCHLQAALNQQVSESNRPDILTALRVVKLTRPDFATKCFEAIWFPCANVDCERFLSSYNTVLTDRRTTLTESKLATMAIFSFEDLSCE
ncbi:uncharacterized protein LOC134541343 isoform X1 [Bacillus rossius redtenbacheri]|uniref:uncharacterized protein LOC134541343 isoform X1 n=1 Tax=Bacillus rossius redtenbacheri TaxID=93214 RepID=UPI002FDCBA32